jgi:hypothetical protein
VNERTEDERLIELATLSPSDPRRVEAVKDPHVRAWLLEHDAFVEAGPILPEDEGAVTRAAESAIARARAEVSRGTGVVLELKQPPRARRASVPRWALAAAGVLVVVGAALVAPRFAGHESGNLRSLTPGSTESAFVSLPATHDSHGRLVLQWNFAPGATSYRVEILRGLDAVASHDVPGGRTLMLDPASLPAGDGLLWRVLALSNGEVIATTAPRELSR